MNDPSSAAAGERLRKVFDHSHDAGFVLLPERDAIVDVNPASCLLLGYTREELLAKPISTIHPDEMPKFVAFAARVQQHGSGWTDELSCLTKSGERVPSEISAAAVELDGRVHIVAWVRDIRARKEAEKALEESRSYFRTLFEHVADGVLLIDPALHRVLDVNPEVCRTLGYTRDELIGKHPSEFAGLEREPGQFSPVSDEESAELLRHALHQDEPMTLEGLCRRKDGSLFPFESRVGIIHREGKVLTLVTQRDMTERREAEQRLRASEERFRTVVETAPDAIYLVGPEGQFLDVNQQACANMGYARDDLLKLHVWDVSPSVAPERLREFREKLRASGPMTVGSLHRRKDGSLVPVEVRLGLFTNQGQTCHLAIVRDVTDRVRAEEERHRMALEIGYLQEELQVVHDFAEIIGTAPAMHALFRGIEQVAGTDSTVLLLGETGTGKELVARAVHGASQRKGRSLVKVNCAALSAGLIESELFGHERGAFTGAIERRIGRFELADGGTIFLDEIGDLPADLQAKLLRVLQEGEFERVGGKQTIAADVRVIAATNRDLERALGEGRFREDLYYRLNVFPLRVPPLRERTEDIRLLIAHFALKYGAKVGKKFQPTPPETLAVLERYSWPGNVRELEHAVERAAILSRKNELDLSDFLAQSARRAHGGAGPQALDEVQKQHILSVLERTAWRIGGPKGAARILGMKPTTLASRMQKLGIQRPAGA